MIRENGEQVTGDREEAALLLTNADQLPGCE